MLAAVRAAAPRSRSMSASGTGGPRAIGGGGAGAGAAGAEPAWADAGWDGAAAGAGPAGAAALAGGAAGRGGWASRGRGAADRPGRRGGWAAAALGWLRSPGRPRSRGPPPGGSPRADPVPSRARWRRRPRLPRMAGRCGRCALGPVRPPPWAGSSRRRSSTTPCPPSRGRPGSAGTAHRRAIRWDRSRWPRPAPAGAFPSAWPLAGSGGCRGRSRRLRRHGGHRPLPMVV